MEVADGEREASLERMRLRKWKAKHDCRRILEKLIGDAVMESDWRQQACKDLVMESVENAMMESRRRLYKELRMETIVTGAWDALEVRRIVKDAKDGGVERMERVEADLRMDIEERDIGRRRVTIQEDGKSGEAEESLAN